jgi:hypothetical protein
MKVSNINSSEITCFLFINSFCTERLLRRQYRTVLCDVSTGRLRWLPPRNVVADVT